MGWLLSGLSFVSVNEADDEVNQHQDEDCRCQNDKGKEEIRQKARISHVKRAHGDNVNLHQRLQKDRMERVADVVAPAARGILQYLRLSGAAWNVATNLCGTKRALYQVARPVKGICIHA